MQNPQVVLSVQDQEWLDGATRVQAGFYNANRVPASVKAPYPDYEWQFRIGFYPTPENIQKAIKALAPLLLNEKLDFKFFVVNGPDYAATLQKNWNGPTADSSSDRDQRGKELCVYMSYDDTEKKFIRTPPEWKTLMMRCWKTLIDAGVEGIGYAGCPYGDRAVPSTFGLYTPFTVTAFKPWDGRYGILLQDEPNPNQYPNPLEGLEITIEDFYQFDIPISESKKLLNTQIQYFEQHNEETLAFLNQPIVGMEPFEKLILNAPDLSTLTKEEASMWVNKLAACFPAQEDSSLTNHELIEQLRWRVQNAKWTAEDQWLGMKPCIDALKTVYDQALLSIEIDLIYHQQTAAIPALTITGNPRAYQLLNRQLTHFEREQTRVRSAQGRLHSCELMEGLERNDLQTKTRDLISLMVDQNYWKQKHSHGNKLPKGVAQLKAVAEKYSKYPLIDVEKFWEECRVIASQRLQARQLPLARRHPMTSLLYELFTDPRGHQSMLYKPQAYHALRDSHIGVGIAPEYKAKVDKFILKLYSDDWKKTHSFAEFFPRGFKHFHALHRQYLDKNGQFQYAKATDFIIACRAEANKRLNVKHRFFGKRSPRVEEAYREIANTLTIRS